MRRETGIRTMAATAMPLSRPRGTGMPRRGLDRR